MSKCSIYWDSSIQAYRMKMDYRKQIIDFLKANIPVSDRQFDETTKVWTFTEKYFQGTLSFAKLIYGNNNITVLTREVVEQTQAKYTSVPSVNLSPLDKDICEFFRLLPYEASLAAYRNAAMQLHPDRGGSMDKMSSLNTLWGRIKKELYSA